MIRRCGLLGFATVVVFCSIGLAADQTRTLLLLHTNDIHAHLRSNDSGNGGLPYVSAYIKQVRRGRNDVLVLDAGDVLEKGDMVSWLTRGKIMYEAMNRIGYDAGVPGNHDFAFGPESLKTNMRTADFPLVCANPNTTGVRFKPSVVVTVNSIRIGIIGITVFGSTADKAAALARETKRLLPVTDLQIALCHQSSQVCRKLADAVPEIDVLVSGHSHEVLKQPVIAKKSGALIVQAGSLARYVGHWELTVDMRKKKIVKYQGKLVSLPHATSACDRDMVSWIRQQESRICPQASKVVGTAAHTIRGAKLATLFAQALLQASAAEIALSHTSLLRGQIYPGPIEINDLFTTVVPGRQRAPVEVQLSGTQLRRIVKSAERNKGDLVLQFRTAGSALQDTKSYRVVLIEGLWSVLKKTAGAALANVHAKPLDFDLIEACAASLQHETRPLHTSAARAADKAKAHDQRRPTGVVFLKQTVRRVDDHGDNWCLTWAANDSQITSMCDGDWLAAKHGYHTHLYRILGGPDAFTRQDIPNYPEFSEAAGSWFGYGIISVGNVLYTTVSKTPGPAWSGPFRGIKLLQSPDNGRTWYRVNRNGERRRLGPLDPARNLVNAEEMFFFEEYGLPHQKQMAYPFSYVAFVHCGKANEAAQDGYVYVYSPEGAHSCRMLLARVPKDKLGVRSEWEYFAHYDNEQPVWTRDLKRRGYAYVFPEKNRDGNWFGWYSWLPSVVWNKGLGVYIMVNGGTYGGSKMTASDHDYYDAWMHTKTGSLGFWWSRKPYGPWHQFYYTDYWTVDDPGNRTYQPKLSPKWISDDGKQMTLIWSDAMSNAQGHSHTVNYRWNQMQIRLRTD